MLSEINQGNTNTIEFHLYVESKKKTPATEQTKENKNSLIKTDQTDDCQPGGDGRPGERRVKGKIVNNTVITLNGDRWLLDLVS